MFSFLFFLFNPSKRLVYWENELSFIAGIIIIISFLAIWIPNLLIKYKRERELIIHKIVFWMSILVSLVFLILMCEKNSEYLELEGGAAAWLSLIINGLLIAIVASVLSYLGYAYFKPLRKHFVLSRMKKLFIF